MSAYERSKTMLELVDATDDDACIAELRERIRALWAAIDDPDGGADLPVTVLELLRGES